MLRANSLKWVLPIAIILFMMLRLGGTFRSGLIQPGKVKAAEPSAAGVPFYTVSVVATPQVVEAGTNNVTVARALLARMEQIKREVLPDDVKVAVTRN